MRFYKNPGWIHLDARGPPQIKMDDKKSMPDPLPVINLRVEQSIENSLLTLRFLWTNPTDYSSYMVYGLRTATGTKNSRYDGDYIEETMQVYSGLDPTVAYTFTVQRAKAFGRSLFSSGYLLLKDKNLIFLQTLVEKPLFLVQLRYSN